MMVEDNQLREKLMKENGSGFLRVSIRIHKGNGGSLIKYDISKLLVKKRFFKEHPSQYIVGVENREAADLLIKAFGDLRYDREVSYRFQYIAKENMDSDYLNHHYYMPISYGPENRENDLYFGVTVKVENGVGLAVD